VARRRRGSLHVASPETVASAVIQAYVDKARSELPIWVRHYESGVIGYINDVQRQNEAKTKLANWYRALLSIVGQIAQAFAQAKAMYRPSTVPTQTLPQVVPAR